MDSDRFLMEVLKFDQEVGEGWTIAELANRLELDYAKVWPRMDSLLGRGIVERYEIYEENRHEYRGTRWLWRVAGLPLDSSVVTA